MGNTINASIPLAAQAPQQPNMLEQYSRLMALKNMRQQGQIQDQTLQENQMKLQQMTQDATDSATARAILNEANGDMTAAKPKLIAALGPKALPLIKSITDQDQAFETLEKTKRENAKSKMQTFSDAIDETMSLPPEQRPAAFAARLDGLVQNGAMTPEHRQQVPPWDDKLMGAQGSNLKQILNSFEIRSKSASASKAESEATSAAQAAAGTTPMTEFQKKSLEQQASNVTEAELALKAANGDVAAGKALGIMTANRIKETQAKQGVGGEGGSYSGSLRPTTERNPKVLENIPTGKANQVLRMVDGREPIPSGMAMRTPYWQEMMRIAGEYEPGFDATQWRVRLDTRVDFAKGKAALQIRSLNTLIKHLDQLWDASEKLNNTGVTGTKAGGFISNIAKEQFGSAALKDWDATATAAGSEMAALLKGASPTDQEMMEQKKIFNRNDPKAAQQAAIKSTLHLAFGRLDAVKRQFEEAFKKQPDFRFLTPQSEKIAKHKLGVDPNELESPGAPSTTGPAPVAAADPRVKAYADKYFGGDVAAAQTAIAKQRGGQ